MPDSKPLLSVTSFKSKRAFGYLACMISCCFTFFFIYGYSQPPVITDSLPIQGSVILPDSLAKLHITSINIVGNKRTKSYIILREVQFKQGDSLNAGSVASNLEQARRQVHNLNLFSEVSITLAMLSANEIAINILVREKWYIYPTPQFQLADRNFNEWLNRYNADFNRVVYGVKFSHYNLSGRGDQLRIFLLTGYSRNISVSYSSPASDQSLTKGFRISAGYTQNREVLYKTNYNNTQAQFRKPGFVRRNVFGSIAYQKRKGFFKRQFFNVTYSYVNVNDSIIDPKYNSNYLNSSKSSAGIIDFGYSFSYSNTDNINYPLDGMIFGFTALKRGLGLTGGINMFTLSAAYSKYFPHKKIGIVRCCLIQK